MTEPIRVPLLLTATGSLAPDYFSQVYAAHEDPWDFQHSSYEAEKYSASLAALPRRHYRSGLELGCSIGVFTRQLAERCGTLLAVDVSERAIGRARARCADAPRVVFEQRDVTQTCPSGPFDVIVASEIGYYWSQSDLEHLRTRLAGELTIGGHLLLVHYTGQTNYPLTADAVHDTFLTWEPRVWIRRRSTRQLYRLDLLEKVADP
jgi:predicted TPR repeat methyltransferase